MVGVHLKKWSPDRTSRPPLKCLRLTQTAVCAPGARTQRVPDGTGRGASSPATSVTGPKPAVGESGTSARCSSKHRKFEIAHLTSA